MQGGSAFPYGNAAGVRNERMSEECTHDCSTCGESCSERDLRVPANALSSIKKVIAVVSGKGGVGKSTVTSSLAVAMARRGRKVAVLGDMGELGDLTDQAHYNMGALAAMLGIDEVVAIGAKAEKIADGAAQSGGSVTHFATKEEAIRELTGQLGPNTAMLVKASHAMHFEWIVEELCKAYD